MQSPSKQPLPHRAFRFLLRMFPFEFRWDYGRDMENTFEDQRREIVHQGGTMAILRLWWETLTGIFTTAPREHWEMLKQDGGYALRLMRKNPGFTVVVVLTLALGIGANTAIFSVINGVLLRPLPFAQGEQLLRVRQVAQRAGFDDVSFSPKEIADYREQNQTLAGAAEYHSMPFTLLGQGEAERLQIGVVSANYFDVLGVKPMLGRLFQPGEDRIGAEPVLVLTYGYWKNVMGGDPKAVGKTFQMNDRVHTVIGVLPPLPDYPDANLMYMPSSSCPFRSSQQTLENRDARMLTMFARRKPGVSIEQASADLSTIANRLEQQYPGNYPKADGFGVRATALHTEMTGGARTTFLILLGTAGLVLLLACANVANLTLSRQIKREHELAIRATLGASRARVFRQLLTESILLAIVGGGLGLLVAAGGISLLVAFAARFTPSTGDIRIDATVLLFTLGISFATGILFGSIPAFASRQDLAQALNQGGGRISGSRKHRIRNILVTAQVAISFILLIGAGLMLRTLVKLQEVDPGFHPENVLSSQVSLNFTKYRDQKLSRAFYMTLLEHLSHQPGVQTAAVSMTVPLDNQMGSMDGQVEIEGRPTPPGTPAPKIDARVVSPQYFSTMGIPLLRGRDFTNDDRAEAPLVAIINQAMARHNWGAANPVGQRVSGDNGKTWMTIVGMVGDVRQYALNRPATDELYVPMQQNPLLGARVLIRTAGNPMLMAHDLVRAVHDIDPLQPVTRVYSLEQIRSEWLASPRLTAVLITLFAGLALLITIAGISGVMALAVSQRTREIGIRMALGATKASVLRMVLWQGMLLVVIGLLLGVAGAPPLTRLMSDLLFGVRPTDPLTFLLVALTLLTVAAVACFVPSRRAASVDPMLALRNE